MGCTAICLVSGLAVGLVRRRRNMCALVFFILSYTRDRRQGMAAKEEAVRSENLSLKPFVGKLGMGRGGERKY